MYSQTTRDTAPHLLRSSAPRRWPLTPEGSTLLAIAVTGLLIVALILWQRCSPLPPAPQAAISQRLPGHRPRRKRLWKRMARAAGRDLIFAGPQGVKVVPRDRITAGCAAGNHAGCSGLVPYPAFPACVPCECPHHAAPQTVPEMDDELMARARRALGEVP